MVLTVERELEGQRFIGINGGPQFKFASAASATERKDQDEVDHYWEKLTARGGKAGRCGWLTDKAAADEAP